MIAHEYTAPSSWASYFINGDASGMEPGDKALADQWLDWVGKGAPVGCEEMGFRRWHDASHIMNLAADCQRYTFLTEG